MTPSAVEADYATPNKAKRSLSVQTKLAASGQDAADARDLT
jgi:hypothetical protein